MKKTILLILLLQQFLFGCAACQLMTPTAYIDIDLNFTNKQLNDATITWKFNDLYTSELKKQYDKNRNDSFDPQELKQIKKAMVDYLVPKKMLTKISYATNEKQTVLNPSYGDYHLEIKGDRTLFSYKADIEHTMETPSSLSFVFEDDEAFFSFVVENLHTNNEKIHSEPNLYLFTASLEFMPQSIAANTQEQKRTIVTKPEEKQQPQDKSYLKQTIDKIQGLFEALKDKNNPWTYLFLLSFAFAYGIVHALGPGHGKTLVSSYFLSHDRSYARAAFVALAIGFVHTFSAFLLTLSIYYLTNTFFAILVQDTVYITTKISALIILGIALYLAIKKYRFYKQQKEEQQNKPAFTFSATPHPSSCGCGMCKAEEKSPTDFALIISAGIIPCPGTITLFIFSFSLGLYFAGFLAALVMSLGMSAIIFLSAILSVIIRKKSLTKETPLKKVLEFSSLAIIFTLGVVLLLS